MRMADRYLINQCLCGDSTAFGVLVDKYKESIYALAYSKLRNFHDAEDVTQEAFIKAYQNLRTLRQWDDFHAWIYAIASNLCKDWLRAKSRRPDREFIEDQSAKSLNDYSPHENPAIEMLHEALDSLPETYQQILTLHYLGGMDGVEIAEFLGVSPTSIWQRLSRARSLLRKEMLDMMSETFEQQRLRAGFTFHIVETIKRIRINPMPPKTLPWGLFIATGLIIAAMGIGAHINVTNNESHISGSAIGESKILNVGEFPVDMAKVSDESFISNQYSIGNGLGSIVPSLQNALLMAPQAGDTWVKKADMPTARDFLSTSEVNGKIYAIGGAIEVGGNQAVPSITTVEEYDPRSNKWVSKSDMPTARDSLATGVVNGKIYAIGGCGLGGVSIGTVEEYDPPTNKWTKKADIPIPSIKGGVSACSIGGKIYVIGGWDNGADASTLAEYDPENDNWVRKADLLIPNRCYSVSAVNGKVYVIGGFIKGVGAHSRVEEYDPANDKWTRKADMPTARGWLSTSTVNGKIYAFGGTTWVNGMPTVEEYDPIADKWVKRVDMPTGRIVFSTSVVGGRIYAIGGSKGDGISLSTAEEYDPGIGESINFKGKLPTTWGELRTAINR
jgi:RNA polymerase sigma factor (sigma-70 family)